jgi:hypothetical protein
MFPLNQICLNKNKVNDHCTINREKAKPHQAGETKVKTNLQINFSKEVIDYLEALLLNPVNH